MPGLFIPTLLSTHEEQGLSVYPGTPGTDDEYGEDTEAVTGIRREAVTYVFERGGTYKLPPLTLSWWNIKTKEVETAEIPALLFEVEKSLGQHIEELPRFVVFSIVLIVRG